MLPSTQNKQSSFFSVSHPSQNNTDLERRKNRLLRRIVRIFFYFFVVFIIAVGALYIIGVRQQGSVVAGPSEEVIRSLSSTVRSLHTSDISDVQAQLDQNNDKLVNLRDAIDKDSRSGLFGIADIAFPLVSNSGDLIKALINLNGDFLKLFGIIGELSYNGFNYLAHDGKSLLLLLEQGEKNSDHIIELSGSVKNITRDLKRFDPSIKTLDAIVGESYLAQSSEIGSVAETFRAARELLTSQNDIHILVLFEDNRILLPGGGTIIAYGDVIIRDGQLRDFIVRAADAEKYSTDESVEPPFPINALTKTWELTHALWSPHFESSVMSAKYILERGEKYRDTGISFDSVISVSRAALGAIVNAVGPISLNEKNESVITGNNIISNGITGKEIETIAPTILSLLETLNESSKIKLLNELGAVTMRGDIRYWANKERLNAFFKEIGISGGLYNAKKSSFESYAGLTVTRAPADKSPQKYTATFAFTLDSNGDIGTDISIDPISLPKNGVEHMQIITSENAQLIATNGNVREGSSLKQSYSERAYEIAPELEAYVDSQALLSNFMTWRGIFQGKEIFEATRRSNGTNAPMLSLRYNTPNSIISAVSTGNTFTFVVEMPPGINCACTVTATAPLGFVWKESNTATITINKNNNARIIQTVTLLKQ